jgi:hypothetical protein
VRERHIQACAENYVILLLPRRRIGRVNIGEGVLPTQPLADLRYRAEVERSTVLARIAGRGRNTVSG